MKNYLMPLIDKLMLRKRFIVATVFDTLKSQMGLIHSRIADHKINRIDEWLGLKPNTLAKMRVYGNGPAYRKHGQRVLYSQEDLQEWSDDRRRSSTSETPDV